MCAFNTFVVFSSSSRPKEDPASFVNHASKYSLNGRQENHQHSCSRDELFNELMTICTGRVNLSLECDDPFV